MARSATTTSAADKSRPDRHPADLVETGNLLRTQQDAFSTTPAKGGEASAVQHHDVIVVGAGQAGLSVSHHLKRRGIDHVVLEGAEHIGDVWRNRWDSLRLFTSAKFDSLDGYRFPASKDHFPTKNEMADYLESYAERFALPVHLGAPVERLHRPHGRFRLETPHRIYEADQVVVAAAGYQRPARPAFAKELAPEIRQLHSLDYRSPAQVPDGPVLLVGAGNSGAEIAMDLAKTHRVYLAGRDVGHVPFDIHGFLGRKLLARMVLRVLFHRLLTVRTPMGRRFRSKMHGHGMPLIRTRPGQLQRAGVQRVGRIVGLRDAKAVTEEGAKVPFASVIWCTGFHSGFDWIDLPISDGRGVPRQRMGKSTDVPGLYFAGLHFQYSVSSTLVSGVGRDARRVAKSIAAVAKARGS